MGKNSHVEYRNTTTGRFVPTDKGKSMPPSKVVREHVPNSGRGDTKGK